ncbi:MAG: YesL family protein [Rubrobacter sp.]
MNLLDTRVYRWLEVATDFFLLNLMWLVACVPVVTIFPSTAAMFGVVRDWTREKEGGLVRAFALRFRENFAQSLLVGVVWTLFGAALVLDFFVAEGLSSGPEVVMKSLLVLAVVLYASASVFLFPVMVHYETGWLTLMKNSLLLSIGRLPTTAACLLFVAAAAVLTAFLPLLIFITGSVTAYIVYRLCDREFARLDA